MANITSILEKLWRKVYHVAINLGKKISPYHMDIDYLTVFNILEELKVEVQKSMNTIRQNLLGSRPIIFSPDQLQDYLRRVELANEILRYLDHLLTKTFDTYIQFIRIHWEKTEALETIDQQRSLSLKYDMSLTDWQSIVGKIDRFNEMVQNSR